MAKTIVPRARSRKGLPQARLTRVDPELEGLIDEYIEYLAETTGKRLSPGQLAEKLTYEQLADESDLPFHAWCVLRSGLVRHVPPSRPSWPLKFDGFDSFTNELVLAWATYSGVNGVPMTTGEVVRGMTFMFIDDDEDFRCWRTIRRAASAMTSQRRDAQCRPM